MNYFVYIIQADDGFYYTGQTNNVEQRLQHHQRGRVKATKYRSGWRLVHSEEFSTRAEAMKREKQIKARKSRRYIERLIKMSDAWRGGVPLQFSSFSRPMQWSSAQTDES